MRVLQLILLSWFICSISRPATADEYIIGSPLLKIDTIYNKDRTRNNSDMSSYDYTGSSFEPMSIMDHFADAIQHASKSATLKLDFQNNLDAARRDYFALYPDKSGVDIARDKLSNLLVQIDLYYLSLYVSAGMSDGEIRRIAAIDRLTGGPFGQGIHPSAIDAFRRWVDVAREAMGAIPRDTLAGRVNAISGAPIPDTSSRTSPNYLPPISECTKSVIVCSQTSFVPTPAGYIEGIKAAQAFYAYYVIIRDRAELSAARNIPLTSLPSLTVQPPTIAIPIPNRLVNHDTIPFDPAVLGSNNFEAARSMGMTLPNGTDKWTTYEQVVKRIVQSGQYKLIRCTYSNSDKVYYFWNGVVPPYFSQLVFAVTVGGIVGDAARLGTKPVSQCPSDEIEARRIQEILLKTLDRPSANAAQSEEKVYLLDHIRVGAASPSNRSYSEWQNSVKPENADRFNREIDKAILEKQQVLECEFPMFGFSRYFFYWYKTEPANVTTLIGLVYGYNGAIVHMGTSGRETCPQTFAEAKAEFSKLNQESARFVKY